MKKFRHVTDGKMCWQQTLWLETYVCEKKNTQFHSLVSQATDMIDSCKSVIVILFVGN